MMRLNGIRIKLPKTEKGAVNFLNNCERRKRFVKDVKGHYKKHLKKAKHDLYRAIDEFEDGCWDWTIVKSYYAIFHAGNALLSRKKGVFSKDHSCLIIALKIWDLIGNELFSRLRKVYERFSDTVSLDLSFQLRKISQYDVDLWEDLTREDAKLVLDSAKEFVEWVEGEVFD
ncbi:MAG: HEPN domain-containing protein [Candidatus Aenigmarchaeota archaeon]|nr:HEPN domain-containing protein [Candidatus Aenigmarchaeota archaeon]